MMWSPECGTPLRIERDQPRTAADPAWRLGLAGLVVTGTVGVLGLLASLGVRADVLFFGVWTAVTIACIIWWVRCGRQMLLRQYPDVRKAIVFLCWFVWMALLMLGGLVLGM